jgi:hypothetical protein
MITTVTLALAVIVAASIGYVLFGLIIMLRDYDDLDWDDNDDL